MWDPKICLAYESVLHVIAWCNVLYNTSRVLALYKSYWAAMDKTCVNKMTWAFFLPGCKVSSFKLQYSFPSMEKTSEKLPNVSIGIDLLGPDPTRSKNKAELKKLASCAFLKFVGRPAAANFGWKIFTGNRKDTNWSSTTFIGKISVFIVVFNFVMHFCYRRTIRLNQENFTYNNKTNYTRRQIYYPQKHLVPTPTRSYEHVSISTLGGL